MLVFDYKRHTGAKFNKLKLYFPFHKGKYICLAAIFLHNLWCHVLWIMLKSKSKKDDNAVQQKTKWSHEQMLSAVSAYKNNPTNKSIQAIVKDNGVPESTLRFTLKKDKDGVNFHMAHAFGEIRRRLLTEAEENLIFKHIKDCSCD